jgi:hypothetical protein
MNEGTRNAVKVGSFKEEAIVEKKSQSTLARRQRTCSLPLSDPLCVLRWEESFQSPDEGLQNILKVTKCSEPKSRSTSGRKEYKSRIPSIASSKTSGIKSIYICNDPTGAKIQ